MGEVWTPYGLEKIRRGVLWRRRLLAILAALLILAAILVILLLRPQKVVETEISLAGGDNSNSIEVEIKDPLRTKPLRVTVSPGGVTLAGNGIGGTPDSLSRAGLDYPYITDARPIDFLAYLLSWGPLLLVAYLVWAAGRGETNPASHVNFGIYKGAMPLEMITESYSHLVKTQRLVVEPIFGKDRSDYLPAEARPRGPVEFQPV